MVLATIVAALIMFGGSVVSVWMTKRMKDENSTQHDHVQRTIIDHSTAIGGLTVGLSRVETDVREVRSDVREIRDAVIG